MSRTLGQVTVNNFVGGLVTDYHELNTPPNVTIDEDNCDLNRKGYRQRRKGIDFEEGSAPNAGPLPDDLANYYLKCWEWDSVANNGNRTYLVVQVGAELWFYDLSTDTISDNKLPFTVNLNSHLAPAWSDTSEDPVQVTSGKGALFVVGQKIVPFYINYSAVSHSITETEIDIFIRDFEEQDITEANDATLSSISNDRKYDLFNQGWFTDNVNCLTQTGNDFQGMPYQFYRDITGNYPPKTKPWFIGKRVGDSGNEGFIPAQYDIAYGGNTLASLGHYVIDPFNIDRSTISGVSGLSTVVQDNRPQALAFMSGRIFYAFQNRLMFSQVITDTFSAVGKCYQDADPTAEDINDLIDTDGGVIRIDDAGEIIFLYPMQNSLIVFASNGVWVVNGSNPGQGFSATGYSIASISALRPEGFRTIIDADGTPVFWADNGIYAVTQKQTIQGFDLQSLIDKKIQAFYDNIDAFSRARGSAIYDRVRKTIIWMYPSQRWDASHYACDKFLNYDTVLGAFFPYTIPSPDDTGIFVADGFNIYGNVIAQVLEDVKDNSNNIVVTNNGTHVQTWVSDTVFPSLATGSVKYLTFDINE